MVLLIHSGNNESNHDSVAVLVSLRIAVVNVKVNSLVLFALIDTEFYKGNVTEAT